MQVRPAKDPDAKGMSHVLQQLVAAQKRSGPSDMAFIRERYIDNPAMIKCMIAANDVGTVLGFQTLLLATENNTYNVTVGWGLIGTHISPTAARLGIGNALFAETQKNARAFGLKHINASIGKENSAGLAYYEAMDFTAYRSSDDVIFKRFRVS